MGLIWSLIVGGIIGAIAGVIMNKGHKMGVVANIFAGLIGSSVGQALLGDFGPKLADMAIIPSIIGAMLVIAVVSYFTRKEK